MHSNLSKLKELNWIEEIIPGKSRAAKISWHYFSSPTCTLVDPWTLKHLRRSSLWERKWHLVFSFCQKELHLRCYRVPSFACDMYSLSEVTTSVQYNWTVEELNSIQKVRLKHEVKKLEEDLNSLINRTLVWLDKIEKASLINCFKFQLVLQPPKKTHHFYICKLV